MEFVQPIRERKQIEKMKKFLRTNSMRDYCLFIMGINSGLRISDLLKLTVGDVLDQHHNVHDRITLREKKTNKSKDFPLSDTTKRALLEYMATRTDCSLDEALFPSRKGGTPISRQHAWRIINDAARYAGIKDKVGTHTLRKTFGYHAFQSGVDVTRIQKLLNHSSPAVTLAYIGVTQEELDDVYLNLNL